MNELANFETVLNDRIVCGDGDTIASKSFLYQHVLNGLPASDVHLSLEECDSDEIQKHNKWFFDDQVTPKNTTQTTSTAWNIPDNYMELDITNYVLSKFKAEVKDNDFTDGEIKIRYYRIKMELRLWEERGLNGMLRTLIFIINTFDANNVIWGTGRGSSCASYILYLIGLHQVDSIKYDIDIGEFFR